LKYLYLVYVKWTREAMAKGQEGFKRWLKAHEKLCKDIGVKLLWDGIPYTTVEESAFFYETDMPLIDFHLFKAKVFDLEGGGWIEYGNTHIFLSWPFRN
jgi:hypothetical protein